MVSHHLGKQQFLGHRGGIAATRSREGMCLLGPVCPKPDWRSPPHLGQISSRKTWVSMCGAGRGTLDCVGHRGLGGDKVFGRLWSGLSGLKGAHGREVGIEAISVTGGRTRVCCCQMLSAWKQKWHTKHRLESEAQGAQQSGASSRLWGLMSILVGWKGRTECVEK